jgi:hypothetical protein
LIEIPFRDENGALKSSQLDEEYSRFKTKEEGRQVVLHTMDQSKLGYQSPSDDLIKTK